MKKLALSLIFTAGLVASSFAEGNENLPSAPNVWQNMQNAFQGTQGTQGGVIKQPQNVEDPEKRLEEMLKKRLNLTDQQVEQIREIRKQQMEESKNLFTKQIKKDALEEATKNGDFDEDTYVRVSVENAKETAEFRAKYLKKTFSILNEDQKRKFIEYLKIKRPYVK